MFCGTTFSIKTCPLIHSGFLVFLLLLIFNASAAQPEISSETRISLLTCRPGDPVYSTFGHTAIRIQDPVNELDIAFNYGIFSFEEKNFTLKFLRGKLPYILGIQNFERLLQEYRFDKRSVFEQVLNLSYPEKKKVFAFLVENYKPEIIKYMYVFFFDNCSTRPRDVLKTTLDPIKFPEKGKDATFRTLLTEYTWSKPWMSFGIDLLIGAIADRKAGVEEQMFLPEYLMGHLDGTTLDGHVLTQPATLILDFENEHQRRKDAPFFTPILVFCLFLVVDGLLLIKRPIILAVWDNWYNQIWYFFLGIGGVVVLFMWFGTDHMATKSNYNMLWLNPLFLGLLSGTVQKPWVIRLLLVGLVASLFIPVMGLQQFHFASVLIIISTIFKLTRLLLKLYKKA